MNRNLIGNLYGWSSIKIAYFVQIRQKTLIDHGQFLFLIGQFLKNLIL
jgi:hypothetical protein